MSKKPTFEDYSKTSKKPAYSDDSFWDKVESSAKTAGQKALKPAFQLYYAQEQKSTPKSAKTLAWASLAYFIWPWDAAFDPIYIDDVGVMTAAIGTLATYITPAVKRKATIALNKWLGK